jgi:hypothetical protein
MYAINQRLLHIKKRMQWAWDEAIPGWFNKRHPWACSRRLCRYFNSREKYRVKPSASDIRRMKNPDDDEYRL